MNNEERILFLGRRGRGNFLFFGSFFCFCFRATKLSFHSAEFQSTSWKTRTSTHEFPGAPRGWGRCSRISREKSLRHSREYYENQFLQPLRKGRVAEDGIISLRKFVSRRRKRKFKVKFYQKRSTPENWVKKCFSWFSKKVKC